MGVPPGQTPCQLRERTPGLQVRPVTRHIACVLRARVHIKAQLVIPATERATQDANLMNTHSLCSTGIWAVSSLSAKMARALEARDEEANRGKGW